MKDGLFCKKQFVSDSITLMIIQVHSDYTEGHKEYDKETLNIFDHFIAAG